MDPELYNKCEQDYEQSCLNRQHDFDQRQHRWELLQQQANKLEEPLAQQDHHHQAKSNHIDEDSAPPQEMQIDIHTIINVPEQIPEEPEHSQQQDDTSMSVDATAAVSPSAA